MNSIEIIDDLLLVSSPISFTYNVYNLFRLHFYLILYNIIYSIIYEVSYLPNL